MERSEFRKLFISESSRFTDRGYGPAWLTNEVYARPALKARMHSIADQLFDLHSTGGILDHSPEEASKLVNGVLQDGVNSFGFIQRIKFGFQAAQPVVKASKIAGIAAGMGLILDGAGHFARPSSSATEGKSTSEAEPSWTQKVGRIGEIAAGAGVVWSALVMGPRLPPMR